MKYFRHILTAVLVFAMVFPVVSVNVSATEGDAVTVSATGAQSGETKAEDEKTEEEKKKEAYEKEVRAVYQLPVQTNELKGWPQGPGTYGDAAIVMDAESGAILYAKNIDKAEYPASITKVLTALLAYEYGDMNAGVVISAEAMGCLGSGYASIGMKAGNIIYMWQAMRAMLMASSNEVAYAIGETVAAGQGQDYNWFISQMNEKVKELGGVNSNFVNTNGVHDENHYTCARDMALIGKELFAYPEFFEICQTQEYRIEASNTTEEHVFQQKHEMLIPGKSDYYDKAIGGKTGYTTEAQNTLITMADDGNMKLVCVVLKTYGGHVYSDTKALLEYAFQNFEKVSVLENETDKRIQNIPEDAYICLPKGIEFDDLDMEIEKLEGSNEAKITYLYKDMPVGTIKAETDAFEGNKTITIFAKVDEKAESKSLGSSWLKIFSVVLIICIILVVLIMVILSGRRAKKRRETRQKRRMERRQK